MTAGHKTVPRGVTRLVSEDAGLTGIGTTDRSQATPPAIVGLAESLLRTLPLRPERLVEPDAWVGHIPFAFWLIGAHKPTTLVELGTHTGNSYSAFCQAVARFGLGTTCYAVDTWLGDPQAGLYGEEVFTEFRDFHDPRYGGFSRLIRSTFDEALDHFADGAIDLLHIDGCHTYEAVRHDYDSWQRKLSDRGVVLFHDINVRERDFGVWRLWDELTASHHHFAFLHSHGLGVLALGTALPEPVRILLAASGTPASALAVRDWFAAAGQSVGSELKLARSQDITRHRDELMVVLDAGRTALDAASAALDSANAARAEALVELDAAEAEAWRVAKARMHHEAEICAERDSARAEAERLRAEKASLIESRNFLRRQLEKGWQRRKRLRRSLSWRATKPLRLVGSAFKRLARGKARKGGAAHAKSPIGRPPPSVPRLEPNEGTGRIGQLREEIRTQAERLAAPIGDRFTRSGGAGGLPWLAPQERAQFRALVKTAPRGRIAVVVHVYYPELWAELSAAIATIDEPIDLYVTLVADRAESIRPKIMEAWPFAHVLTVANHGRDILPLLSLARTGVLFRYELMCKLHTKRSDWHEDGETWRRTLIDGVLGSTSLVRAIVHAFDTEADLGLLVADGHTYSGPERWEGNRKHLTRLFGLLGMDDSEFTKPFAGGSIYWLRPAVLRLVSDLPLPPEEFEREPLGNDGNMVHAIERLISLVCYEAGMTIKETGTVAQQGSGAASIAG